MVGLQGVIIYTGRLSDDRVSLIAGALVHGIMLDAPVDPAKRAAVVEARAFRRGNASNLPIVKLTNKVYADGFFDTGSLQLGTFAGYQKHGHPAVRDGTEGKFLLVGRNASFTTFAEIEGGYNHWVFCCRRGVPAKEDVEAHGYDAAYQINFPRAFARAIKEKLHAQAFWSATCQYSPHKVIVDEVSSSYNHQQISHLTLEMAGFGKYFVKPEALRWQSEHRFIWRVPTDVEGFQVIHVPEVRHFCERLF